MQLDRTHLVATASAVPLALALALAAMPTTARAADVPGNDLTPQVGIGASLSFVLGDKPDDRRRVGGEVHAFGEMAAPVGENRFHKNAVSAGAAVGIRTVGAARPRIDLLARLGGTQTALSGPGHLTYFGGRAVAGIGFRLGDAGPDVLVGIDGRALMGHAMLLAELPLEGGAPVTTLDLGPELGLIPAAFID